jgi:endonuclease/exonuclease/phosphatase family metal-dependent hydrolase/methionine-rich copper-binding protein CopC
MEMNGFAGSNQINEDWLISPKFDLSGTNIPLLDFYTKSKFDGAGLVLKVSTDYTGTGNPAAATWTTISGEFPVVNSDVWKKSDSLNLSAFKTSNVYIAWVYTSSTTASSRWTLDDIRVYNSAVAPLPTMTVTGLLLDFREVTAGLNSTAKTFTFSANDVTANVTVTAPAGFTVSKDGLSYSSSISYTPSEAAAGEKTVYVRFSPSVANTAYAGNIQISSTGLNNNQVVVKGNSYPFTSTLNLANWNIEWFGSTGNGPADNNLQKDNAKKVMDAIGADAYGISEIVDVTLFGSLVSSLNGGYSYVIADYCSGGSSAGSCGSAQKTAFVYKTSMFSNVSTRALLKTSTTANTNWSNGRLPMLVTADVTKNGETKTMNFIVIHAKANTGTTAEQIDAYARRKAGVQELKDTLDAQFPTANIILMGDYNDDLDRTIAPTTGDDTVSSYQPLVVDSTDANHYASLTLILSRAGLSSTATNPEMIDHVVISNELKASYVNASATIYTDIATLAGITNYDATTSDHFPVLTRYVFSAPADVTPPTLVSTSPVNNATGILTSFTMSATFSENIAAGTGNILVKKVSDNTVAATINAATVTISGAQASWSVSGLLNNTAYYVEIPNTAIKDLAGNAFAGISGATTWKFTTVVAADVTPPTLSSTNPPNNATGVPTSFTAAMTFSENVFVGVGSIVIRKTSDNSTAATIPIASATFSSQQVSFNVAGLQNSTQYYVEVPATAIKDIANNAFAGLSGASAWTFTTVAPADVTPPVIVTTNPLNNASNVATSFTMQITFSENIVLGTGNILIKRNDNTVAATTPVSSVTVTGAVTSWAVSGLQPSTTYYVEIPNTAFKDQANNFYVGVTGLAGYQFTTGAATVLPQIDPAVTEFSVYPNPVNSNLVFSYRAKAGKAVYRIYDLQGKLVKETYKTVGTAKVTETMHIAGLPAGTYIINVVNNGYFTIQKFTKQ